MEDEREGGEHDFDRANDVVVDRGGIQELESQMERQVCLGRAIERGGEEEEGRLGHRVEERRGQDVWVRCQPGERE